ncbi:hypothetical protein BaRGS_00038674, partial [Batillaria attramentaria]
NDRVGKKGCFTFTSGVMYNTASCQLSTPCVSHSAIAQDMPAIITLTNLREITLRVLYTSWLPSVCGCRTSSWPEGNHYGERRLWSVVFAGCVFRFTEAWLLSVSAD